MITIFKGVENMNPKKKELNKIYKFLDTNFGITANL